MRGFRRRFHRRGGFRRSFGRRRFHSRGIRMHRRPRIGFRM